MVVKPNTAGASVGRARCRHQKVVQNPYTALRGSAAQSSWCICPPNCLCLMGVCAALEQGLGGPTARSSWKIRKNGGWEARRFAVFSDWNTHFVVFSGGVERGLGGLTARSNWKIRQNGGWEARRSSIAGALALPAAQFYLISPLQFAVILHAIQSILDTPCLEI